MTSTQLPTVSKRSLPRRWEPSATLSTVRLRAKVFAVVRSFFAAHGVLEVDTPVLSCAATVDPQVESLAAAGSRWLHTSPEFPMKRLLAAGSGPIYQIAHVFRADEVGRHHQPEFAMLEWYRPGFGYGLLMDEVAKLLRAVGVPAGPYPRISYRGAFVRHADLDPFSAPIASLRQCAERAGVHFAVDPSGPEAADRDFWLDLLMGTLVAPHLGRDRPAFVYDYPASQAALSEIRPGNPSVAERFELFWCGVELANGWHELRDAAEQRRRFERDLAWRAARGRAVPPMDEHLLAALEHGLPDCSGVALGLDRLVMLMLGLASVAEAQSFDGERA